MQKVLYNVVIDEDLFQCIYDYISFHYEDVKNNYNIVNGWDYEDADLSTFKGLANDTIDWIEKEQFTAIYHLKPNDDSPSKDTWGTLYYQVLAYMDRHCRGELSFRHRTKDEQAYICRDCVDNLKELAIQIRELKEEDL